MEQRQTRAKRFTSSLRIAAFISRLGAIRSFTNAARTSDGKVGLAARQRRARIIRMDKSGECITPNIYLGVR
jgi:demethoxyubiquinone hydroxylase (CLK1/Coq7/Cat5 family)